MSERDLIYRDLSCRPTPLHYHPAHACVPFYLTPMHSLPPCPLTLLPSIWLSVCLSSYLPGHLFAVHIPYAYNLIVWLNQMDLPSLTVFFHKKQMIALQMALLHLKQRDLKLALLHFRQF